MPISDSDRNVLGIPPTNRIIKVDENRYITELNDTKDAVVDRYQILKKIGKGGFATVYELRSLKTGIHYAGKVVKKEGLVKAKVMEKFMSEINIHQSLDHRHVCKMYKHFEDENNHILLLEYCSHDTLGHLLKKRKHLTEPEVQCFLLQIIDAVKYLHSNCIIHRDLKLGNIFLDDNLEVKVGDFGLATRMNSPSERKKTLCGTPNYIAPEILVSGDKRAYSYEVDIWAIGVITYTMFTGNAPFDGGNVESTYNKIRLNALAFPRDQLSTSKHARTFIRSILTTDPANRLVLDEMVRHPFFTDSPVRPPESLPLSILNGPYLLTTRPLTEPTPVLQRVRRDRTMEDAAPEGVTKRVRMTDLAASVREPASMPLVTGRLDLKYHVQPTPSNDYDYDGNGRNDLMRFSLTAERAHGMEEKIDLENRSFVGARGLTSQETFDGLPVGIVPSVTVPRGRFMDKMDSNLLFAHSANLYTAIHHSELMANADGVTVYRTNNWIVDEYDFTRKYGIGYMFSSGIIGILFNDKTSIVVSSTGMYFEYYPRLSISQWTVGHQYQPTISGDIDDYPEELTKKITLIKYFRSNFLERMQLREVPKEEIEDRARGGPIRNMPFVVKWLLKDHASVCMLNTGAIQVRYEGGTILNFENPFDDLTYLDKYGVVTPLTLEKAITINRDDLNRRLLFICNILEEIVTKLSKNK